MCNGTGAEPNSAGGDHLIPGFDKRPISKRLSRERTALGPTPCSLLFECLSKDTIASASRSESDIRPSAETKVGVYYVRIHQVKDKKI